MPSPSLRCSQFVRLRGFSAVGSGLVERSRVREQLWVGVVVRFVCLIRVSLCPCVPCNPSPRCLFTGLRSASPRPLRMPVSASRVSSSSGALAAPPAVTHLPRAPSHFADRLRAGAGRRSGSGWRQGRVRWGRPLLSRPQGAVDSGPAVVLAAVESAAVSGFGCRVVVRVCRWVWMLVRFVCVLRFSVCPRVRLCVPCVSRLPPVSFYPVSRWVGLVLRLVCEVLVSVS